MKEVEDENALEHMFDKAHLKRTADLNNVGGTETRPSGFEVLSDEDWPWLVGNGTGIHAYHTWLILEKGDGCLVVTEETQNGPSAIAFNLDQPTAMYDAHHWWLAALKVRSERAAEK